MHIGVNIPTALNKSGFLLLLLIKTQQPSVAWQAQNQYNLAQFGGRLRLFHLGEIMGYHT